MLAIPGAALAPAFGDTGLMSRAGSSSSEIFPWERKAALQAFCLYHSSTCENTAHIPLPSEVPIGKPCHSSGFPPEFHLKRQSVIDSSQTHILKGWSSDRITTGWVSHRKSHFPSVSQESVSRVTRLGVSDITTPVRLFPL